MSRTFHIMTKITASLVGLLLFAACGDGTTEPPTPDPSRPTTVTVTPATAELGALGATVQLTVEVFDQNGQAMAGAAVTWASSAAAVATVSASGLVTAVANGSATVTATAGGASGTSEITVVNPDRAVLIALYEATDGPNWVNNNNWLTDNPLDEWYGVDTDASGQVVHIDLSGRWDNEVQELVPHGLTGEIPPELGALASLESLILAINQLTGEIPPELGALASLESLILAANQLTGEIPPELGGLRSLWQLHLQVNQLSGNIPAELGDLIGLELLSLWDNQLTGEIPPELGGLASLASLILSDNQLTGEIPPELGALASLYQLGLTNNQLTGDIPAELGQLGSLLSLYLNENPQLAGALPLALSSLSALEEFYYNDTGLCVPTDESFRTWLNAIADHRGTGVDCSST